MGQKQKTNKEATALTWARDDGGMGLGGRVWV